MKPTALQVVRILDTIDSRPSPFYDLDPTIEEHRKLILEKYRELKSTPGEDGLIPSFQAATEQAKTWWLETHYLAEPLRILFLDIDGVLVTDTCDIWEFAKEAVENLQTIMENSDCKIVISSSWAMRGRDTIVEKFKQNGFDIEPFLHEDWAILDMSEAGRKGEMIQWLRKHPEVVAHVAIDDTDYDLPHQVLTDSMLGIVDSTVEQALELLLATPRFSLE